MKRLTVAGALFGLFGGAAFFPAAYAAEALPPPVLYPAKLWQGRSVATVRVLNRIDSHVETLTIPVDGAGSYKSLHIQLHRCLDRPPTLAPDSAVFITITDDTDADHPFDGWMMANEPALSAFSSPLYQVRLLSCTGDPREPSLPPLPAQQAVQAVSTQPTGADDTLGDPSGLTGSAGVIEMAPSGGGANTPPPSGGASGGGASTGGGPMSLLPPAAPQPPASQQGPMSLTPPSGGPQPLAPPRPPSQQ